jgi:uncharacterized protein (TIGR02599 family)
MKIIMIKEKVKSGFTLVEMMVSVAVVAVLMLFITQVISQMQRAWRQTGGKAAQFREARKAFDLIQRNMKQSVLNSYSRYYYRGTPDPLSPFKTAGQGGVAEEVTGANVSSQIRYSELQFICGPASQVFESSLASEISGHAVFFQVPLGHSELYSNLPTALNGRGYLVRFGINNANRIPPFVGNRVEAQNRYRLLQYTAPTEQNRIYDKATRKQTKDWFSDLDQQSVVIAENILAIYFSPRRAVATLGGNQNTRDLAPNYFYDSANPDLISDSGGTIKQDPRSHTLPPVVDVIMVAIDSLSAQRLQQVYGDQKPFDFEGMNLFSRNASDQGFREDLKALQDELNEKNVNYRIFSGSIPMRNSEYFEGNKNS